MLKLAGFSFSATMEFGDPLTPPFPEGAVGVRTLLTEDRDFDRFPGFATEQLPR